MKASVEDHPGVSIDHIMMDHLRSLLKDKFSEALQIAVFNTDLYIGQIRQAIEADQHHQACAMAHKIASSAGSFGLLDVVTAARAIEYADHQQDQGTWMLLWQDLHSQFANSMQALEISQPFGQV